MLQLSVRNGRPALPARRWTSASAADAARLIPDGAVVAVQWIHEDLAIALADGHRLQAQPRDLTLVYATARGPMRGGALNRLARTGLVRRVIGGQWHPVSGLQDLADAGLIESYSLPVAVIRKLFRDIADGMPGHLSRSGLGTASDPRHLGGRMNRITTEELVFLVRAGGSEALLYRSFPIDVALVSVAFTEPDSTLAMSREAMLIARAARASGGLVIAQQNPIGVLGRLPRSLVVVPDSIVDVVVSMDV
jgi:propionate CoA-transferase